MNDLEALSAKLLMRAKARSTELQEAKRKYSPEVIQRYREMQETHAFRHQVEKRVPVDLNIDAVTLNCGHTMETMIGLLNATDGQLHCLECEKEWLAKAVAEEKSKQDGSDK